MSYKNYTFEQEEVSDLYKEVHNIRPKYEWWVSWNNSDNDKKQKIWNDMIEKSLKGV